MLWLYLVALVTLIHGQILDSKAFRPCFERYPNNRLVGVQPYHSEWRMKTEDSCLQFCAQTSSRCRSVVFDSVQHICHFFLNAGENMAVPAAKMIYLRVTNKSCLDQNKSPSAKINQLQTPRQQLSSNIPQVTVSIADAISTKNNFNPQTWMKKKVAKSSLMETQKSQSFKGSFENLEDFKRDLRPFDVQQRYITSMEKLEKNDADVVFKKKRIGLGRLPSSHEELNATKARLETDLRNKLEKMKTRYPSKYSEYVGPSRRGMATSGTIKPTTTMKTTIATTTLRTSTTSTTTTPTPIFTEKPIKKIQFKEDMMYTKKSSRRITDIRRRPISTLKPSFSSYIPRALSFLESINGKTKNPPAREMGPIADICGPDDSAIWVTFENSLDSEQESIDSSSMTKEECQEMCDQLGCKSFSFLEKDVQCMINEKSDGVYLKSSSNGDFSASTSVKFCYSKSLPIFRDCSTFVGFREFAIDVVPREQFDGLPLGYQGMQLCLELCVLSTEYTCRSASFFVDEGRCVLNAYDSISKPENFLRTQNPRQLYFENGCSKIDFFTKEAEQALNIIRVPNPDKSPLKALQIKKIK